MTLVAVIGAGVVGLTTALNILKLGHKVVIIAELFPGDEKSIRYTSNWAGASHMSFAGEDKRQEKLDRATFDVMWKMSEPGAPTEKLFMRVPLLQYSPEERTEAHPLDYYPDFRWLSESELRVGAKSGVMLSTLTIDVWPYLAYLYAQVILNGGQAIKAQVQHITQVAEGAFSAVPDALVVCPGLGARFLGGVEDKDVYPSRGQTVLIRAPWFKYTTGADGVVPGRPEIMSYIIPRRTGDVILGGTMTPNDWYPKPRPEITTAILQGTLEVAPELAPPHVLESGRKPTVADLEPLIIEVGCGLRPCRKGGIRLESDTLETYTGKRIPVVYNYGHGGQGYQSSWGSAEVAADLLKEALQEGVQSSLEDLKLSP